MFLQSASRVFKGGYGCSGDVGGLGEPCTPEASEKLSNAAVSEVASDFP